MKSALGSGTGSRLHLKVGQIKRKKRIKAPAPPFTTSALQQEASRKLNFTSSRTMQVVQGLYEGVELGVEGSVGLVTYIRTDSVRVSAEAVSSARDMIERTYGEKYLPKAAREYKASGRAQDAHEAIRPTDAARTPDSVKTYLSREQLQLYRLIHSRFLASQMQDAVYETFTADLISEGVTLRYYASIRLFGFLPCMKDENEQEIQSSLPDFKEGDPVRILDILTEQRFTQPPGRYTEASLIRALEEKGIGRPSTYAPTIGTILSRGYVSREKKKLYPTQIGKMVNAIMLEYFAPVVDLEFTAQMENRLDRWRGRQVEIDPQGVYPSFHEMNKNAETKLESRDSR